MSTECCQNCIHNAVCDYWEKEAYPEDYESIKIACKYYATTDVTPIKKATEEEKAKFKSLFAEKEQYYKLSTIYDLAFEDDVNGTCDGKVDAWLIATLTPTDVKPVVRGRWYDEDSFRLTQQEGGLHYSPIYRCSVCNKTVADYHISEHKYCLHCGAEMEEVDVKPHTYQIIKGEGILN